jgi:uncharacterized membrane protein YeiH
MELMIPDTIGTIAFALAGYIVSTRANYDILGIIIITFTSAFAGGVTRDILIGNIPGIFLNSYSLLIVIGVIIIGILLKYHHKEKLNENKLFVIADTVGLSVFAYTGAMVGIDNSLNFGGVLFLALISAIGGGLYRDVMMNKEVYAFKEDFYGAVAIIVGIMVYIMDKLDLLTNIGWGIIIVGIIIRLTAIKFNWYLPKVYKDD